MKLNTHLNFALLASFCKVLHDVIATSHAGINRGPPWEMNHFSRTELTMGKIDPAPSTPNLPKNCRPEKVIFTFFSEFSKQKRFLCLGASALTQEKLNVRHLIFLGVIMAMLTTEQRPTLLKHRT